MAASQSPVMEARTISSIEAFEEAVRLQKLIWGFEDIELLPPRLFVVANKIGGQTFAVFDGDRMVAFLLAIPGLKADGSQYLHSHMMGALPEYRNRGLGRSLKRLQRHEAIERGIDLVEWTFDPLELKNAFFNIERLGAIVRRFVPNQYGTTSSPLHGGLPTDRCVAEWWLNSPRVVAIEQGFEPERPAIEARIAIPVEIGSLRRSDPSLAREIQSEVSACFVDYFRNGLSVVGFERSTRKGTYLLGRIGAPNEA